LAAQIFEDLEVVGTRVNNSCIRASGEFIDEGKNLIEGRWSPEYSRIGDDPDQAGKGEG
jgi:hypothetical protein